MDNQDKKKKKRKWHGHFNYEYVNRNHYNRYGFVEIDNPEYYTNNGPHAVPEFLLRKPTPKERKEIVVNYIRQNSGKYIDIYTLALKLAVSYRTIQKLLKELSEEKIIDIIHTFDANGKQTRNLYVYNGDVKEKYGTGLTLEMIFDVNNKAGLRDWDWDDYKFKGNGDWNDFDDLNVVKIERNKKRRKYLHNNNEKIKDEISKLKYVRIDYVLWVTTVDDKLSDICCRGYYRNGTKRYDLHSDEREFELNIKHFSFKVKIIDDEINPTVIITNKDDLRNKLKISYLGDNHRHYEKYWEDNLKDCLNLTGSFITR